MAVTYTKGNSNWQNYPTVSTPITEDKLDNFETGIDQIYALAAAKGDLISGSSSRNLVATTVGANDRVLVSDSAQTGGIKWVQIGMGQLATGVGTNDTVLVADSGQAAGMKWVQVGNSQVIANAGIDLSKLESGAWDSYTPTVTGSGSNPSGWSITAAYTLQGQRTCHASAVITTASTLGTGTYAFSLPAAASTTTGSTIGAGVYYDTSTGTHYFGHCHRLTSTTFGLYVQGSNQWSATVPVAIAVGDIVNFTVTYQTAS